MAESVDATHSKCVDYYHEGSSPSSLNNQVKMKLEKIDFNNIC